MRRSGVALLLLAVLAAAAAVVWWTAPPGADARELSGALSLVPAAMDGAAAVAQPQRAARWLVRHRQVLLLAQLAAPHSGPALARLRPLFAPVIAAADGPLVVWWRGEHAALAARVRRGAVVALEELAARAGLATRSEADLFLAATSPELLGPGALVPPPLQVGDRLAALVGTGGGWWRVRLGRSRLDASTGSEVDLPKSVPGSVVSVADLSQMLTPLIPLPVPQGPALLVVEAPDRWGLSLPAVRLGGAARTLLRFQGSSPVAGGSVAVERWRGVLGDIWVSPAHGVLVASHPDLVARLVQETRTVDEGAFRGSDAAWLLRHLASFGERLPGLTDISGRLSRAAPDAAALDVVRWHLEDRGGSVQLTW